MAFQVTDEALDKLDQLDDDQKREVLTKFKPEELQAVHEALPAWKAKRAAVPVAPTEEAAPPVGVMGHLGNALGWLDQQKDKYIAQPIEDNIRAPARAQYNQGAAAVQDFASRHGAGGLTRQLEYLNRGMLSKVAGDAILEEMPEAQRAQATNDLEGHFGPAGAAMLTGVAQGAGDPLTWIPLGKTSKIAAAAERVAAAGWKAVAVQGLKAIPKAALHGAKVGAGIGLTQALTTPKAPLLGSVVENALGGAAISSAVAGAAPLVGKATGALVDAAAPRVRALGILLQDGMGELTSSINSKIDEHAMLNGMTQAADQRVGQVVARAEGAALGGEGVTRLDAITPDFDPVQVRILRTPEGQLVARFNELNAQTGDIRFHEKPINTPGDAAAVREQAKKFGATISTDRQALDAPERVLNQLFERADPAPDSYIDFTQPHLAEGGKTVAIKSPGVGDPKPIPLVEAIPSPDTVEPGAPQVEPAVAVVRDGKFKTVSLKAVAESHEASQLSEGGPPLAPPPRSGGADVGQLPPRYKLGDTVYTGANRGPGAQVGRVVGPEANGKVPVLTSTKPGAKPQLLAAKDLAPTLPPGIAKVNDLVPPGLPVPALDPSTLTQANADAINDVFKLYGVAQKNQPGLGHKIMRQLLADELRAPEGIAGKIRNLKAAKNFEADRVAIFNAFQREFTQKVWSAADADLQKVAQMKMSWADFEAKNGQVADKARSMFQSIMGERDATDKALAALGMIPESLITARDNGEMDAYLGRFFMAKMLKPGEWVKRLPIVDPQAMGIAVDFLINQKELRGKFSAPAAIENELARIINSNEPLQALEASTLGKPFKALLKRGEIPEQLKRVMGEVQSGMFRMASTVGNQRSLLAQGTMWAEIAGNQETWSPGPRPDLHSEQIPNDPRRYGRAAGGYTTREIYDSVVALPKAVENGNTLWRKAMGFIKANQVALGGMHSIVSNNLGNIMYSEMAGGISALAHPVHAGKKFMEAFHAIRDFRADPTGNTGLGKYLIEARRVGVEIPGYGANEISSPERQLLRQLDTLIAAQANKPTDIGTILGGVNKAINKGYHYAGVAYDQIDRIWKMANYMGLREKLLRQGMPLEDAVRVASDRINKSFPNPQSMGRAVDKLRTTPFGAVAPYLTYNTENLRVNGMALQRMAAGEEGMRWRMLRTGIIFGSLMGAGGMLRQWNGITDEDVEAARKDTTKRGRFFKPAMFAFPERDSQGRVQFFNGDQFWDPLKFLKGHPDDAMWRRVMSNFVQVPFAGSASQDVVDSLMAQSGFIRPLPQFEPIEGQSTPMAVIRQLWRYGALGPTAASKLYETFRKGGAVGDRSRNAEVLTPGQMASDVAGVPAQPVSLPYDQQGTAQRSPSLNATTGEALGDINDLTKRQIAVIVRMNIPVEEKQKLLQAVKARLGTLAAQGGQRAAANEAGAASHK